MSRKATPVVVNETDRNILEAWAGSGKAERRLGERARIVLLAAEGRSTEQIAEALDTRPARVSKWRMRFSHLGMKGLSDAPRPGQPKRYSDSTEARVLAALDGPPPKGYRQWNGRLLAEHLGNVSDDQIWRVLRRRGISLQRRQSWCISTDPEFSRKAADIVGLYLNPPENAVILSVDEKPCIQALERAQGWLRMPDGRAITGFNHEYRRHGTSTLFAALEVATGQVRAGHFKRRRRRDFLQFMNELVVAYPKQELHVILDNLNTHKPAHDRWLQRHTRVHFHYTPTHASWLNQIEVWFSILSRQALRGGSFTSISQLRTAIDAFVEVYNHTAEPFEWRKTEVHPKRLHNYIAN
jgi:transposase